MENIGVGCQWHLDYRDLANGVDIVSIHQVASQILRVPGLVGSDEDAMNLTRMLPTNVTKLKQISLGRYLCHHLVHPAGLIN